MKDKLTKQQQEIRTKAINQMIAKVQQDLEEVHLKIRTNKRTINDLASEQQVLKKTRLGLTNMIKALTPRPIK